MSTYPGLHGFPDESQDWRDLESSLLRIVRAELGPRLRERLESMDVVQDVLGEVLLCREDSDKEKIRSFRAWIDKVVRNRIRNLSDYHGSARRSPEREAGPDDGLAVAAVQSPVPDQVVEGLDRRRLLESLAELPETQRMVILLRDFEVLPWDEVAALTGLSTGAAARMSYTRAIVALTRHFSRPVGE